MSSDISNEMDLFGGSAATASSASAARFVPSADGNYHRIYINAVVAIECGGN